MENYLNILKKYSKRVYLILLFTVVILGISYLFPREGKFSLEYTKGEPWRHEVLIAPYDFPILKSPTELRIEKDSLLQNFRPYFTYDSTKLSLTIANLSTDLQLINSISKLPKELHSKIDSIKIRSYITALFEQCYIRGIITLPETYSSADENMELNLITGTLSEPYGLSEFFQVQTAYKYITEGLSIVLADYLKEEEVDLFISELNLNKYVEPNIKYDVTRSVEARDNIIQRISTQKGKVISGQRIIDKGDIIDDATFKILESYKKEYETRLGNLSGYSEIFWGQLIIITALILGMLLFLFYFRKDVYRNNHHITFILLLIVITILMAKVAKSFPLIPIYTIPFAILPLIIRTFFDSRLALFTYVITILLASFFATNSFEFIFLQIPIGITAIFSLFRMVRRSQLVRAAIYIFLTYCVFHTALTLVQEGDINKINPYDFTFFAINGGLLLLVYPLIYIFEKLFGFLSDVTLVELSDTNHPLLRKLSEQAPGTFQHSIQVGNLAQEAAYMIDANPLLVRAGAMYHDIGKTIAPIFFTENQTSGINPHENLDFEQSAQMVINHIDNGVKIARKHKIPEQIIDFITTHQGTAKTKYFYNSFVNKYPDKSPDISAFSYPGPTPFTKETAILMMADSVEAASRSIKEYTDDAIDKLVENIINAQINDDQFINAPITFKEISDIKAVFKRKIKNIYHNRISYPEINNPQKTQQ